MTVSKAKSSTRPGGLPVTRASHTIERIDRIDATFDDSTLIAIAGLVLVTTLTRRLGLGALPNTTVRIVGRVGGARPGRKELTVVPGGDRPDVSALRRQSSYRSVATARRRADGSA